MLGIFNLLKTIASVILAIVGFIPALILGFVKLLINIFGLVSDLAGFIPQPLGIAFIALVALCVLMTILGR